MNIIDVGIILLLGLGAVLGFKRGFTRQVAQGLGFIAVIIIAFILKNPLSELMYQNLPFFDFGGILKGVTIVNILLYEVIAFLIVLALASILLKLVIFATSVFEKILNMTIILGIPSKILGAVAGVLEYYVIVFMILFVISLPMFNYDFINGSKYKDTILNNTPILTNISQDTINVYNEFSDLKDKYQDSTSSTEFNKEAIELFLKYKVISVESVEKLAEKGKLNIDNMDSILEQYREE
ncbi:MAG: CvpA family protein [Bacilli bacterium]|nr:CvpA family protein [Bacilli bacterium]